MNGQNNNATHISFNELDEEVKQKETTAKKYLNPEEKDVIIKNDNEASLESDYDALLDIPYSKEDKASSDVPYSKGNVYKPLPDNDTISLIWTEEQSTWWKNEPNRIADQKQFYSNIMRLPKLEKSRKAQTEKLYLTNAEEDIKKLQQIEKEIDNIKALVKKYIDISALANTYALQKTTSKSENRTQCNFKELYTEQSANGKNINAVYYEKSTANKQNESSVQKDNMSEIVTDLLPRILLNLYTDETFKNKYLSIAPNTALFWYNCDFLNADKKQPTFWEKKRTSFNDLINKANKKLDGRDSSKILAKHFKLEAVREVMESIDGEPDSKAWAIASWIFAREASGTVFVCSSDVKDENYLERFENSHWRLVEHPTLLHNEKVDMIVSIDIKNPDKINSIEFPNGLIRENLANCTFEIERQSLANLISDEEKLRFDTTFPAASVQTIPYSKLVNLNLNSLSKSALRLDVNTSKVSIVNRDQIINVVYDKKYNASKFVTDIIGGILADKAGLHKAAKREMPISVVRNTKLTPKITNSSPESTNKNTSKGSM